MEQLIMLGTGNAMVTRCYNTCFALSDPHGVILTDAGGGNGILQQLAAAHIPISSISHMILTHEHCDHVLGAVWVIRSVGTLMKKGTYPGTFTIYCHGDLGEALQSICRYTLQKKFTDLFGERILFVPVKDGSVCSIGGCTVTFFDIHSTKATQFGYRMVLNSGKIIACLGDEPFHPLCRPYVEGADWLLSEAFCLYEDRDRFHPYEKHHSTVKEACMLGEELHIPNLLLYHTEDSCMETRKMRYTAEGAAYYHGRLLVPDDLETIEL